MPRREIVEVQGLDKILKQFKKAEEEAIAVLQNASDQAIKPVLREAQRRIPKKTGAAMMALDTRREKSKKRVKVANRLYIKSKRKGGVRYGVYLEFGTKKTKAHHFMRGALDVKKNEVQEVFNSELLNGIDRGFR